MMVVMVIATDPYLQFDFAMDHRMVVMMTVMMDRRDDDAGSTMFIVVVLIGHRDPGTG